MPFLAKRGSNSTANTEMQNALRLESVSIWEADEYRSSRGKRIEDTPAFGQAELAVPASRRLCANEECASGWTVPWRSRRRPIFEGQWGCSGRCVLTIVRAAVRREVAERGSSMVSAPHRHRVPLGLVLLAQDWITNLQLQQALEAQRANGRGRIGDWLQSVCGVGAEQITRGLSLQWNCPVLGTEGFYPEAMALVMPKLFAQEFGLLPLRVAGSRILYLAFEEGLNARAALALEQMSDLRVESGLMEATLFQAARNRLLGCEAVEARFQEAVDADTLAARITAVLEHKQPVASRLVRLHQYYWLRIWLETGAMGSAGSLPKSNEDVCDYVFTVAV
jgi:hypothetical protein